MSNEARAAIASPSPGRVVLITRRDSAVMCLGPTDDVSPDGVERAYEREAPAHVIRALGDPAMTVRVFLGARVVEAAHEDLRGEPQIKPSMYLWRWPPRVG
jgi:hypothetical protein